MTEQSASQSTLDSDNEGVEPTIAIEIPPQLPVEPSGNTVTVDVPAVGERTIYVINPGDLVQLDDPAFDPAVARFFVDGNDLVVTTMDGGVVLLRDFFVHGGEEVAWLAVEDGPSVPSLSLIQEARAFDVEPTAGPESDIAPGAGETGGNASFSPYDQGDIGTGPGITGPLGATASGSSAGFEDVEANPFLNTLNQESAAADGAPTVSLRGGTTGTIADIGVPPDSPPSTKPLPELKDGVAVADEDVNGIDQSQLVGDGKREIKVRFESETAGQKNTLGYFTIDADGNLRDPAVLFPNMSSEGANGMSKGDEASLGVLPEGQQYNFFMVSDGAGLNPPDIFTTGRLELRDSNGGKLNLADRSGAKLFHIADDGTETEVQGKLLFGADQSHSTPDENRLNPDGKGHVLSGIDPNTGELLIAFEDKSNAGGASSDRDFNDAIIRLKKPSVDGTETVVPLPGPEGLLNASITDGDNNILTAATVKISNGALAGDRLKLFGFIDANDDGVLDGTNLAFKQVSDTEIELTGEDTIENYQAVLNSIKFVNSSNPKVGDREIELTVTDNEGNTSAPATATVSIEDKRVSGTDDGETIEGDDTVNAISGKGGDDRLFGLGGNDVIDGGDGDDRIDGGDGDDLLNGGQGADRLWGGEGADVFRFNSLAEGRDTILDFNANEGDRLDLSNLFDGTGFDPLIPSSNEYLRFWEVDADGDGQKDDIQVVVDLDGNGTDHVFTKVFTLYNPVGINADSAITDVTTYTSTDGATS